MKKWICLSLLLAALPAAACQVPVFRYALERWPPDFYQLVIFHEDALSEAHNTLYTNLKARVQSEELPANMYVDTLNVTDKPDHDLSVWFKQQEGLASPSMVLFYPTMTRDILPAWQGEVSQANIDLILDSPIRRQILGGILRGDSAVWVLLESGNKEKDDTLVKLLQTQLKEVREGLEIPDGVMTQDEAEEAFSDPAKVPIGFDPSNVLRSGIPLNIDFSILRMPRNAEGEDIFQDMLLNRYEDVPKEEDVPLIYVIFGQGRVLGPITEEEIEEDALYAAGHYLCGACSCEVKAQNPGMDVVMSINWWTHLEGSEVIEEKGLPPLVGTAELLAAKPDEASAGSEPETAPEVEVVPEPEPMPHPLPGGRYLVKVLGGVLIGVVVVLALLTLKFVKPES